MMVAVILLCLPFLAAAALTVPQPAAVRRWVDRGSVLAVLALSLCLPWQAGQPHSVLPLDPRATLIAILVALGACAARVRTSRLHAAHQAMLGGMLLAALSGEPLVTVAGLAIATTAAIAHDRPARWHRVPLAGAGLGLLLFGTVTGPSQLAAGCALLGLAALAVAVPEALVVLLAAAISLGKPAGPVLIAVGLLGLLACAGILLARPNQRNHLRLVILGQSGVVAVAFGLGSTGAMFAGLVLLILLIVSQAALSLARVDGLDVLVAAAGLAGVPPFGVFPGVALVLIAAGGQAPWLLAPLLAGLGALGWSVARRLPSPRFIAARPDRVSPAWVLIALALSIGFFLPAPAADWLRPVAAGMR